MKLHENQGGFRGGCGCADKILCFWMFIEKCMEFQLPALAIFVDFKAAVDSIHSLPRGIFAQFTGSLTSIFGLSAALLTTRRLLSLLKVS